MERIHLIFDWGDTLMVDFKDQPGPMAEWKHVEWIEGAKKAMDELYKKYPCYIGSNSGYSNTELLRKAFERVKGEHYFKKIYASKDIGYEKPDIRFFQYILDDLNIKAHQAIMIGNDYIKDIVGGKSAGMSTIFLSNEKETEKFPKADMIIDNMQKLPKAINDLNNWCFIE